MKATILKTLRSWSPKQKKAKVEKSEMSTAFYDSTKVFDYRQWFNGNNE